MFKTDMDLFLSNKRIISYYLHSFITDDAIADEDRRRFEDMGVQVILAK